MRVGLWTTEQRHTSILMADLYCAQNLMCKSAPLKTLNLNVPSRCLCVSRCKYTCPLAIQRETHNPSPPSRRQTPKQACAAFGCHVQYSRLENISTLINNLNRQAMNLRAQSGFFYLASWLQHFIPRFHASKQTDMRYSSDPVTGR